MHKLVRSEWYTEGKVSYMLRTETPDVVYHSVITLRHVCTVTAGGVWDRLFRRFVK